MYTSIFVLVFDHHNRIGTLTQTILNSLIACIAVLVLKIMTSRLRSGRSRRRQTVTQHGACIDLTVEITGDDVIDLTTLDTSNLMDSPVVVLSPSDDVGPVRRRRGSGRRGRRRSHNRIRPFTVDTTNYSPRVPSISTPSSSSVDPVNLDFDISDEELPDIPFEIPKSNSKANASFLKSPTGTINITCPVCLDDCKQIKANKKRIMSTTCGHIFCEDCITNSIQSFKSCPTCRKKLALNKIHPIFF